MPLLTHQASPVDKFTEAAVEACLHKVGMATSPISAGAAELQHGSLIQIGQHAIRAQGGNPGEGQAPHREWVWSESGTGSKIIADTGSEGLERHGQISSGTRPAHAPAGDTCWWKVEPPVGRMVDGLPDRSHRIKALGNSIVPQVAETIFRSIEATR